MESEIKLNLISARISEGLIKGISNLKQDTFFASVACNRSKQYTNTSPIKVTEPIISHEFSFRLKCDNLDDVFLFLSFYIKSQIDNKNIVFAKSKINLSSIPSGKSQIQIPLMHKTSHVASILVDCEIKQIQPELCNSFPKEQYRNSLPIQNTVARQLPRSLTLKIRHHHTHSHRRHTCHKTSKENLACEKSQFPTTFNQFNVDGAYQIDELSQLTPSLGVSDPFFQQENMNYHQYYF